MTNLDEAGRLTHPPHPLQEPAALSGAAPMPGTVTTVDGLCQQLERLRRRHAQQTGGGRPVGLARLAQLCGVPRSTLHTYLTGAVIPSPGAIDAIVLALGASMAESAAWGEALERVLDSPEAGSAHGTSGQAAAMRALIGQIERTQNRQADYWPISALQRVSLFERVQLGRDRDIITKEYRVAVRAAVAGVDRLTVFSAPEPHIDLDRVQLAGLVGCREGAHRSIPELGIRVFELLFDRPLELGEMTSVAYTEDYSRARRGRVVTPQEVLRMFLRRGPTYVLEIAFHREDLPGEVRQVHIAEIGAADAGRKPLRLGANLTAQMAVERAAVGLHGIRWDWDELAPSG